MARRSWLAVLATVACVGAPPSPPQETDATTSASVDASASTQESNDTTAAADTGTTADSSGGIDSSGTRGADTTGEPCVPQPWFPDADGDGYGDPNGEMAFECEPPPGHVDQSGDCDDENDAINPGIPELCNGIDDDCDEILDEGSAANPECNGCRFTLAVDGSRWFALCPDESGWEEAEILCIDAFGPDANLAIIDKEADQLALLQETGGQDFWLSLNERDEPGVWRWHDGTVAWMDGMPVGYDGWRAGEPSGGDNARCGELDPLGWDDVSCSQNQPRICEHPP